MRVAIAPPNLMLGRTWEEFIKPVTDSALLPNSLLAAERIARGEESATAPMASMTTPKINSGQNLIKAVLVLYHDQPVFPRPLKE